MSYPRIVRAMDTAPEAAGPARTGAVANDGPPIDQTTSAPAAPDAPVDRSGINGLIDHLLCFRAACVLNHPGGVVSTDEMWDRYRAWAGERTMARPAFETMFPELTRIEKVDFGGVPHYRGVTLKGAAELAAAG